VFRYVLDVFLFGGGEERRMSDGKIDLGDRFLFSIADGTGASIDRLYSCRAVRWTMILLRKSSGIRLRSPR
jgi:hypothetical protein